MIRILESTDISTVEKIVERYLNYHLPQNAEYAYVDDIEVISDTGSTVTVEVEYHISIKIFIGIDHETNMAEYEYDTEYRTNKFKVDMENRKASLVQENDVC